MRNQLDPISNNMYKIFNKMIQFNLEIQEHGQMKQNIIEAYWDYTCTS